MIALNNQSEYRIDIEKILGSKSKIKVLKILIRYGTVPLSYIRKNVNMNYRDLKFFLGELEKANIIREHDVGGVKIYEVNKENHRAKLLKELFEKF